MIVFIVRMKIKALIGWKGKKTSWLKFEWFNENFKKEKILKKI